jgi:hypothetical protein
METIEDIYRFQSKLTSIDGATDMLQDFAAKSILKGFSKEETVKALSDLYRQCDEVAESKYNQALGIIAWKTIERRIDYIQKSDEYHDHIEIIDWNEYKPESYDRETKVVIYNAPEGNQGFQGSVKNLPHYAIHDLEEIKSIDFVQFVNTMGFVDFS